MSDYIELGSISGFFGVRGGVKIYSYTRPREEITNYRNFYLDEAKTPITFTQIKISGKNIVAQIKGIDSREMVEKFVDKKLYIKKSDLPALENEYYWNELIGLSVETTQGELLGQVESLLETGVNDVLVITHQARETLIPFVMEHFIVAIDLANNKMVVDWEIDNED